MVEVAVSVTVNAWLPLPKATNVCDGLVEVDVLLPEAGLPKFQLYVNPGPVDALVNVNGVDAHGLVLRENVNAALIGSTVTTCVALHPPLLVTV